MLFKVKREFNVKIDRDYYKHDPELKRYEIIPHRMRALIYAQPEVFGAYWIPDKLDNDKYTYQINSIFTCTKGWL